VLSLKRQIQKLHEIHEVASGSFESGIVYGRPKPGRMPQSDRRHFLDVSVFPFS
jgi:hypothetical protein